MADDATRILQEANTAVRTALRNENELRERNRSLLGANIKLKARAEAAEAAARELWEALDGITDTDPTEEDGKPWINAHAALSKWREFRVEKKGKDAS